MLVGSERAKTERRGECETWIREASSFSLTDRKFDRLGVCATTVAGSAMYTEVPGGAKLAGEPNRIRPLRGKVVQNIEETCDYRVNLAFPTVATPLRRACNCCLCNRLLW